MVELRPGSQHSQEGFISFMQRVLKTRTLTGEQLLLRLDSAHETIKTCDLLNTTDNVSYIFKWNPRRENTSELRKRAFTEATVTEPQGGKRVAMLTIRQQQLYGGKTCNFSKVIRVTERTLDKRA